MVCLEDHQNKETQEDCLELQQPLQVLQPKEMVYLVMQVVELGLEFHLPIPLRPIIKRQLQEESSEDPLKALEVCLEANPQHKRQTLSALALEVLQARNLLKLGLRALQPHRNKRKRKKLDSD